jgi:hypothetical protein
MVVEAYYDAISVVPDLNPGTENAVSISILLRIAEEFAANPPARPVLFAAFSGHYQALSGARSFADLWRHSGEDPTVEIDELEETVRRMAPSYASLSNCSMSCTPAPP